MASDGAHAPARSTEETVEGAAPSTALPSVHSTRLDRLIHERLRLGIVSALAVNDSLTFTELRELLQATDGNLSVHARKLEDAGYVDCRKFFLGRRPTTEYRLADAGRDGHNSDAGLHDRQYRHRDRQPGQRLSRQLDLRWFGNHL